MTKTSKALSQEKTDRDQATLDDHKILSPREKDEKDMLTAAAAAGSQVTMTLSKDDIIVIYQALLERRDSLHDRKIVLHRQLLNAANLVSLPLEKAEFERIKKSFVAVDKMITRYQVILNVLAS